MPLLQTLKQDVTQWPPYVRSVATMTCIKLVVPCIFPGGWQAQLQ